MKHRGVNGNILTKQSHFARELVSLLIIVSFGLIAYSNTFHVPFHFDDSTNIEQNPLIQNTDYLFSPSQYCTRVPPQSVHYVTCSFFIRRYIGYLSFAADFFVHGLDVLGYHIVNLGIHIVNGILVYLLCTLCFKTPFMRNTSDGRYASSAALFSSLLFVAHPIQTQAVTYIVQRFTSLATLFYLLALVTYLTFRMQDPRSTMPDEEAAKASPSLGHKAFRAEAHRVKSAIWYLASVCSALLAMFTKEISFTLPITIALIEFGFFSGVFRKRLLLLGPFALTMIIIPFNVLGFAKPLGELLSDAGAASRLQTGLSRWDYLLTQCVVSTKYIRLLFVPVNQNLDYDLPAYHSFFTPRVLPSSFFLAAIVGLGIYLWRRSRKGNVLLRVVSFGIFLFFLTLSVESSIIPIADVIFEHRVYLPSVGAFFAIAGALIVLAGKLQSRWEPSGKALMVACGVIVIALTGATLKRNIVWHDEVSLWSDVVAKSPRNARAHNNLALAYTERGDTEKAMALFDRAIALDPGYADAYNNRGNVLEKMNLNEEAVEAYSRAITIKPVDADYYYNRGYVRHKKRDYEGAMRDYSRAIELDPGHDRAYLERGFIAYVLFKNPYRALPDFRRACELGNRFGCDILRSGAESQQ